MVQVAGKRSKRVSGDPGASGFLGESGSSFTTVDHMKAVTGLLCECGRPAESERVIVERTTKMQSTSTRRRCRDGIIPTDDVRKHSGRVEEFERTELCRFQETERNDLFQKNWIEI